MKFYLLEHSDSNETGEIDATHRWGLPGVICPVCSSTWGAVGLEYPGIDLDGLFELDHARTERAVPLGEFNRLEAQVLEKYPSLDRLMPGTQFGNSVGDLVRNPRKAGFPHGALWTLYALDEVVDKLTAGGLIMPNTVPAMLRSTGFDRELTIIEFDLPLESRIANGEYEDSFLTICQVCGRDSSRLPDFPVLDLSYRRTETDVFRIANFTTLIAASENFVNLVSKLCIPGLKFQEVPTTVLSGPARPASRGVL